MALESTEHGLVIKAEDADRVRDRGALPLTAADEERQKREGRARSGQDAGNLRRNGPWEETQQARFDQDRSAEPQGRKRSGDDHVQVAWQNS